MTMLQKSHDKTRKLVSAGMLSAISIILGMTPLGIIPPRPCICPSSSARCSKAPWSD